MKMFLLLARELFDAKEQPRAHVFHQPVVYPEGGYHHHVLNKESRLKLGTTGFQPIINTCWSKNDERPCFKKVAMSALMVARASLEV